LEKLIYAFWRKPADEPAALRRVLIEELKPELAKLGAERLQFNIVDFDEQAKGLVNFQLVCTKPPPDGIISFWLTSAYRRQPAEALLAKTFARIAGYVVAESTILPNVKHPSKQDERTFGFSQVTFLKLPPRLKFEEWRQIWFGRHTKVGIETQANFRYVQNVVILPLTEGAPEYRGIIEECFPIEAMTDPYVFYDAVGDEQKFQKNLSTMMESVQRFIDLDKVDVIPTSEYLLHSQAEPKL